MRAAVLAIAGIVLSTGVFAQPGPPPVQYSRVTPQGATTSQLVPALLSPTNFDVPRSHIRVWKPHFGNTTVDAGGATLGNRTTITTMEIPDDAIMAQVIYANASAATWTLTNAAISGSSQWGVNGYTGTSPGVTPYDAAGAALTTMPLLSFGNNGADSTPSMGLFTSAPALSVSLPTTAPSSSTTLNFGASISCPPLGSTVVVAGSAGTVSPYINPLTWVTACNAGTGAITLNQAPRNTVPASVTVYFLPPGFTMPASTSLPLPTLTYSDWTPLQTYPRLDGPIMSGETVLNNGASIGTVSSTTATTATLSGNLSQAIPGGTTLQACQSGVTNADLVPAYTIQFAANANIKAGMSVWPSAASTTRDPATASATYWWPNNTVASVATATNTVVTLTTPLPYNYTTSSYGSGATWYFMSPVTTTAQTATNSATLTVADTSQLSTGMSVFQGGGTGSIGGTISSITDSTHVVMTQNVSNTVPSGQTVYFQFSVASNATSTTGSILNFAAAIPNLLKGVHSVVATGIPSTSLVHLSNGTQVFITGANAATVPSGTTVYFCIPVTTTAVAASGQPVLTFASTVWPNRLITLRTNIASGSAASLRVTGGSLDAAFYNALPGAQMIDGYRCAAGTDGVLTTTNVGSAAGTCTSVIDFPVYAIKFYSPKRGMSIMAIGDSHFVGATTLGPQMGSFVNRLANKLSSSTMPVTAINGAWGGAVSQVFGPHGMWQLQTFKPSIVFIEYNSTNDVGTFAYEGATATALTLAEYVRSYGGLPILTSDMQRQTYGVTYNGSTAETTRLLGQSAVIAAGLGGTPVFDMPPILADPVNGAAWFNPLYSSEGVHANDAGNEALAVSAKTLVCSYVRC